MTVYTQQGRLISVTTPLGDDVLLLVAFSGAEHVSRPFCFQLEMISLDPAIKAKDIVGKQVTVNIGLSDGSTRYINGYVNQFVAGGRHGTSYRTYHAEVVPWLQLLGLNNDCRMFQQKSATDIINEVFQSRGFSDFEFSVTRPLRKREYTVQYRESDLQFVSRLMEEEGIFYYFKHTDSKHTLMMGDAKSAYGSCADSEVRFIEQASRDPHLHQWEQQFMMVPGKWTQTDYNFKTPSAKLLTTVSKIIDLPGIDKFEQYDFPGLYEAKSDGDGLTRVRMEETETDYNIVTSAGNYRSFFAGGTFKLTSHPIAEEQNKEYMITTISHFARDSSYEMSEGGSVEYNNSFQCIPANVVFRASRCTRKPFVQGPQTAVVVGPSGEEIYTDEYGRIKVQFHWDREGKKDENSSCWLRVSQQWAGKKWGMIFLPRIGHEVIVSFLEGDPDQPIVTGCVYNAENMPPYDLPANKTQSGWKTRSTKDGGTSNYNEIRFEDKKGSEEIYIHAEKNQNNVVENDETTNVGHDRTEDVGNDETITIGNNRVENVGKDETITIGENRTESVGANESISIGSNRTINVGDKEEITIGADQTISIGKNQSESIGKSLALAVGENRGVDVGKNDSLTVGKKLTIEAGDEITLKTGSASIVMKKNGDITIKGKNITVNGSGKINVKASSDIIMKGSKIAQN